MVKLDGIIIRETEKGMYFAGQISPGVFAQPRWIPKSKSHVIEKTPKSTDTILVESWIYDTRFRNQDIEGQDDQERLQQEKK